METRTEYEIEYSTGRVIRVELDGMIIQLFDHKSNGDLRRKSKRMILNDVINLLPQED